MPGPRCVFVSFRLGGTDGVSIVADAWMRAFAELGFDVSTVAGGGAADVVLPWLAIRPVEPPRPAELVTALAGADLVVVENVLSIPLNPAGSHELAAVLRGRPAILHHHDPPWQRASHRACTELPVDDPAWRHVTVNRITEAEFASRGLTATTIYNGFDPDVRHGERAATRRRLGVADGERLLLHPVRAIERKNIPLALELATVVGATYWLTGPAEDGYGGRLDQLLADARCRVVLRPVPLALVPDAYAAADAVLFPSTWEGFGNPPLEAAFHRRPVVVGHYPVAEELRRLGFCWISPNRPEQLEAALAAPDSEALERNLLVARRHFGHDLMREGIARLLDDAGWLPAPAAPLASQRRVIAKRLLK